MKELYLRKDAIFYLEKDEIVCNSEEIYEIADRIGGGGNGAVYKCISSSGTEYAVKFLLHFDEKSVARFDQEVSLMEAVKSDYLVQYIDKGSVELFENKSFSGTKRKTCFVVMELADGNLLDFIRSSKSNRLDYSFYVPRFRGLCEALQSLHGYAIHRDIKPENVLIKGERWLLSDLGLCECINPAERLDVTGMREKVGPLYWISPEAVNHVLLSSDSMGTYSDVFQMGMVFAYVLLRRYPGGIVTTEDLERYTSEEISKVIMAMLSNNYNKRPQNGSELLKVFNAATYEK